MSKVVYEYLGKWHDRDFYGVSSVECPDSFPEGIMRKTKEGTKTILERFLYDPNNSCHVDSKLTYFLNTKKDKKGWF